MGFLENLIEYMKPKAHDAIDLLTEKWEQRNEGPSVLEGMDDLPYGSDDILGLVMGVGGGGAGKGLRQLILALQGKIKGGRMIPSQPIRKGIVGGPKSSDFTKEGMLSKDFLKKEYSDMLKTGELKGQQTLNPMDDEWLKNQMSKWNAQPVQAQLARKEEGSVSMLEKLLPFLLLSPIEGMGGEAPNIGRPSKQY